MTPRANNTRDERGVAMLYAAVFLLSSVWLVSLALDMGKLMATKTQLQRAADAAALAGASAVDSQTGNLIEALARDRAAKTACSNEALREVAEPVVIDPDADVAFPGTNQVKVTVHRSAETGNPMTTIFARSLGIMSIDVQATATAEVSPINPCDGIPPFAITVGGYTPDQDYAFNLDPGALQSLNLGAPGITAIDSYILDYVSFQAGGNDCNEGPCSQVGGSTLGCYIVNGYGCCLKKGDEFTTLLLNDQFSTVKNSLKDRWNGDTDQREGITYAEYAGNGNRVLICPIVEVLGGGGAGNSADRGGQGGSGVVARFSEGIQGNNVNELGPSRVRIVGFTGFFLTEKPTPNQLIVGRVINYVAPGDPDPDASSQTKLYGTRLVLGNE